MNKDGWRLTVEQDAVSAGGDQELVASKGERNQPECCNGCINSHATCVHSPENDGECVGRETEQPATASEPENVKLCQTCSVFLYDQPCPRMGCSGGACPDYLQPVPECCQTCFSTSDPRKPCPYKPEQDKDGNWVCEGWEDVPTEIRAQFDRDEKPEQSAGASEPEELIALCEPKGD